MSDRRRGLLIGCLSPLWQERSIAIGERFRHGNDRIAVEAIQNAAASTR